MYTVVKSCLSVIAVSWTVKQGHEFEMAQTITCIRAGAPLSCNVRYFVFVDQG